MSVRSHGGAGLLPAADGDPGVVLGRGHQLVPGLHHLPVQAVELQPPHQTAQQHRGSHVGKTGDRDKQEKEEFGGVMKFNVPKTTSAVMVSGTHTENMFNHTSMLNIGLVFVRCNISMDKPWQYTKRPVYLNSGQAWFPENPRREKLFLEDSSLNRSGSNLNKQRVIMQECPWHRRGVGNPTVHKSNQVSTFCLGLSNTNL